MTKSIGIICGLTAVFLAGRTTTHAQAAQAATIQVDAAHVLHPLSGHLTGACLEDVNHEVYGGIYSQMIFGESFQEPPRARLPLLDFTNYAGLGTVADGALVLQGGPGPKLIYDRPGQSSGDLQVQVRFANNQGGDAGLVFQTSQASAGADNFNGYEVSLAPGGYVVLGRHRQNWEPLRQVAASIPAGRWLDLEVQYTNASINVLLNGNSLLQYTDTQNPLTSGQVGLRDYNQDTQFRDFRVDGAPVSFAYAGSHFFGALSGMWTPVHSGSASGECALETTNAFVGNQSQRLTFTSGTGEFGMANSGLNHWGMNFLAGHEYDGSLEVRAEAPAQLTLALESSDGSVAYAQTNLAVAASNNQWQRLAFTLTPSASDTKGRFTVMLTQPGSVVVGYVFLEPGTWGRFRDLPVRKDVAEGLINQGVTVLRYGGSMVNAAAYRWKKMIGPRDRRPPYAGTWYPYSTDGWGIPDFLNFCEAAGFLAVPDFNINETPQDMADFMQYANGPTNTPWGSQRAADGHPAPYGLKYLELGNEETVNDVYYQKFQALAQAIWAADANVVLVVGDFTYSQVITNPFSFGGADSGITTLAAHQNILQLATRNNREVWFDVHVWDDGPIKTPSLRGMFSFDQALSQIAGEARHRVVVFELNANHHGQGRALGNALAMNAAARSGRLPIVTSANCLQPDGENDNSWDQGLLFLNPSQVWLQPPGYVTRMFSQNFLPLEIWSHVQAADGALDVSAERSQDGTQLVLKVVNASGAAEPATIDLSGFLPTHPVADAQVLSAPLAAVNTAADPLQVVPVATQWPCHFSHGAAEYTFAPYSVTTLRMSGRTEVGQPGLGRDGAEGP